jgi:hypothetical protein
MAGVPAGAVDRDGGTDASASWGEIVEAAGGEAMATGSVPMGVGVVVVVVVGSAEDMAS